MTTATHRAHALGIVLLLACAAHGPPVAAAPPEARGEGQATAHLVEITSIARQDPPADLVAERAQLEERLRTAEQAERTRIEGEIERLDREIERGTGYVVCGWSAEVDQRGARVGTSTSMAGYFLAASPAAASLGKMGPGDFVAFGIAGMRDLFTSEGRRYREAKRIDRAARPAWWFSPGGGKTPPAPSPDAEGTVQIAISFVREEPRAAGSRLHRWNLKVTAPGAPAGSRTVWITAHVRVRTKDGRAYGPLAVDMSLDRAPGTGGFVMHRSFEIIAVRGVALGEDSVTVEVAAVAYQ